MSLHADHSQRIVIEATALLAGGRGEKFWKAVTRPSTAASTSVLGLRARRGLTRAPVYWSYSSSAVTCA